MLDLTQNERDKIKTNEMSYIILNHLDYFDSKPEQIKLIIEKFNKLKNPHYSSPIVSHAIMYEKAYEYFEKHNKFPDNEWIIATIPTHAFKKQRGNYSTSIYEDFIKDLDRDYTKKFTEKLIVDSRELPVDDVQAVIKQLSEYIIKNSDENNIKEEDIHNFYEEYSKDYKGVKTHIKELDELVGVLGYKSMSVYAGVSGEGKTSLASTITYNSAVFSGLCVDYITFEVPRIHLWFNLASIESTYLNKNYPASEWKIVVAETDEEKKKSSDIYKECAKSLTSKLRQSGGYINIIDYTSLSASTYEEMCANLEKIAENRNRKADLIVVDNIDGLTLFKSSEKDAIKRVDNMIRSIDQFSKTYYNNQGTHFLLLTQVNREGMFVLKDSNSEGDTGEKGNSRKKKKATVDVRCISTYNALYERASLVLIGSAHARLRALNKMHIYPVKVRNRGADGEEFIKVYADFAHSKIGGKSANEASQNEYEEYIKMKKEQGKLKEENNNSDDSNIPSTDDDFKEE